MNETTEPLTSEPAPQSGPDAPVLRIITSAFTGLLASVLSVAFFLVVAWAIFVYLTNAISFESGGTIALGIDIACIAPLALITLLPIGVFTGRFTHKALARVAATRGRHAERRASFAIFGIAGIGVFLVTLAFVIYQALPLIPGEEREALAKLGNYLTWKSPCHKKNVVCDGNFLSAHVIEYRGGFVYSLKSIPPEISQLSHLEVLDLSHGKLNDIPPELGQLSRLEVLNLSHNQLSRIPPELGNLSNLNRLHLSSNQLSGNIPPELGALSSLENLRLDNNQLSGTIPPELGNLSNLRWLYLSNNQFSGSLPLEMSALSNLNTFAFNDTNLCEPKDAAFQEWLSGINKLTRTGVACP